MARPRLPGAARSTIPNSLRLAVYRRDGHQCVYCGSAVGLSCDHVYPFSQGGSTSLHNLVTACVACNRLAGDRVFADLHDKTIWLEDARDKLGPDALRSLSDAIADDDERAIRSITR